MMRSDLSRGLAVIAMLLTLAPSDSARAWDSICYQFHDPNASVAQLDFVAGSRGCGGVLAARGRWRDPERHLDEHRALFEHAIRTAGLPDEVLETVLLAVPTTSASISVDTSSVPTLAPVWITDATRVAYRAFTIDELAQLPDFSYSGFDWLNGNESCPTTLPGTTAQCHAFKTHMGALNSSHFPPQSDAWFDHLHGIALARAAECRTMRASIWSADAATAAVRDARFTPYFRQCELEALAAEAIAQHYLGDSWSAGHMWNRWGSADLAAFPAAAIDPPGVDLPGFDANEFNALGDDLRRLTVAEIAAATAGTIHGSDAVTIDVGPGLTLHDAMCYPNLRVSAVGVTAFDVAGDVHLHDVIGGLPLHSSISSFSLPTGVSYTAQGDALTACASGAVADIYRALGDDATFGAPTFGRVTALPTFDRSQCYAPMATNAALDEGIDDYDIQVNVAVHGATLEGVPLSEVPLIPNQVRARVREDYGALRFGAEVLAHASPGTTEMASLHHDATFHYDDHTCTRGGCVLHTFTALPRTYTMFGVDPNRCYASAGNRDGCTVPASTASAPASYADPRPPYVTTSDVLISPIVDPRHVWATAFNTAHQRDFCSYVTAADLDHLESLVSTSTRAEDRRAACDACEAFVAAHLRVGNGPTDYDASVEPLCSYAARGAGAYVYEPATGGTVNDLARHHCGCEAGLVAVTDAGVVTIQVTEGNPPVLTPSTPVPVGTLARDVAFGRDATIYVDNGVGQIAGVRGGVEIDLDGNSANGITRITLAGATNLQGLATVTLSGRDLLLAASRGTGELIAWDLGAQRECGRVSVAHVAGEEAYDVTVTVDGSRAYVATRRLSPLSGAIAVVDLVALATCDPSMSPTARFIVPPGAAAGLSAIAISPDGTRLAAGMRLASTCPDYVDDGGTMTDVQVGCDGVFIMDIATEVFTPFGSRLSLPTRPGRYAYGISWFPDSRRIAYTAFSGIDRTGGWPVGATPQLPVGGTLRLGDVDVASYQGGGTGAPRNWTYNLPLDAYVLGETVTVSRDSAYVFVATQSGRVAAYPVAPHDATLDPLWEANDSDPETRYHISTSGSWYGGCHHLCFLPGGVCPDVCPTTTGLDPAGLGFVSLGSPVRVLVSR